MNNGSMLGQQPPLLARPSHGLLARHGWVWLAGPGVALLVGGFIASGLLASVGEPQHSGAYAATGFALIIGIAVIVVGLPVRALVVRSHRRQWAVHELPSLSGRYPQPRALDAGDAPLPPDVAVTLRKLRRQGAGHLVIGIALCAFVLCIVAFLAALAIGGLVQGIHAQRLQHSSSAQHIGATLDRDTTVFHGRGTSYTDHVSYVVDGRAEHDVEISADGSQRAGDTVSIIVDPGDPGDPIAASDHGYLDLGYGGVCAVVLIFMAAGAVSGRRKKRRTPTAARQ